MPEPATEDFSHSQHRALIIAMQTLGYQKDISGVCFGLSHMAMQAIFSNDIDAFNARIARINELSKAFFMLKAELLAECSLNIQPTNWKQLSKDFFELLSPTGKITRTKIVDGTTITTISSQDPLVLDLEAKFKSRTNEMMNTLPLAEKIDLQAFFDSLSIYQNPPDWTSATSQLDLKNTMPFALNTFLETQDGFSKIQQTDGIYTKSDLTEFLVSFRKALTTDISTPLMISLCDINHAISVSYHPDKKQWSFVDANQLPIILLNDENELAEKILLGFSPDLKMPDAVTIHSEILATNVTHDLWKPYLKAWENSPEYIKLHTVNTTKAKMMDVWEIPWLYNECKNLNLDVVKTLLSNGADPNPLFRITHFQDLFPLSLNNDKEKALAKLLLKYHAIPDKYQYQILQNSNDLEITSSLESEETANTRYNISTYANNNIHSGFHEEKSERDKAFQALIYLCKKTTDVAILEKKQTELKGIHLLEKKLNAILGSKNKAFNTIMDNAYKEYVTSDQNVNSDVINNLARTLQAFSETLPKPSKFAAFFGKRDIGRDVQSVLVESTHPLGLSTGLKIT